MTASRTELHRVLTLTGLAIALGLALGYMLPPPAVVPALEWLDPPRPLPALTLTSDNKEFKTFPLHGQWQLVMLGFTHCPDICPVTLAELAALRSAIGNPNVRVVFVSIDPARDSPERLTEYVKFFGAGTTAITGSDSELHRLAKALGMNFRREGPADNPRISHSPTIALIDTEGKLRARLRPGFDSRQAAREIRVHIGAAS